MELLEETIAGIKTYFVKNKEGLSTIVLLHGYKSNGKRLTYLRDEIKIAQKFNWLFPEGFISLENEPLETSRAWFGIDWLFDFQRRKKDYIDLEPNGLQTGKQKVLELLKTLNLSLENVILGGFSQGAMLSTEIALSSDTAPKGLLILSGTLVCKEKWTLLAQKHEGFSFFQSHGKNDWILPYPKATQLYEILSRNKIKGDFYEYEGAHERCPSLSKQISLYLEKLTENEIH